MTKTKFMQKVLRKQSVPVIEFSDIERMKTYQLNLINTMIYETHKKEELKRSKMLKEIQCCEIWLKNNISIFMNDNKRSF